MARVVPQEVALRIASWADRRTLVVLARTTRSFQGEAESRLYEIIDLPHSPLVRRICSTIAQIPRIARHVRSFVIYSENLRRNSRDRERELIIAQLAAQTWESREYWETIRSALQYMPTVEYLMIADPTLANSWILEPPRNHTRFLAQEARLELPWDAHMVSFLEAQEELRILSVADIPENIPRAPLSEAALPNLVQFEGPLIIIDQLLHCPLTNLKFRLDSEDTLSLLPIVLPEFYRFKNLHALNIVSIPEDLILDCMSVISAVCPQLRYLGLICLPLDHKDRMRFLQLLALMEFLEIIEFDISAWLPTPTGQFQRALAIEIRMAVPNVQYILFWSDRDRWHWHWKGGEEEESDVDRQAAAFGAEGIDYVGIEGWASGWMQNTWGAIGSALWKS